MFSSDLEGHVPSRPSTPFDSGGPRSVVAPRAGPADATDRVPPFGCGHRPLWVFYPLYRHRLPSINTGLPVSNTGILWSNTASSGRWLTRTGLLRPKRMSWKIVALRLVYGHWNRGSRGYMCFCTSRGRQDVTLSGNNIYVHRVQRTSSCCGRRALAKASRQVCGNRARALFSFGNSVFRRATRQAKVYRW